MSSAIAAKAEVKVPPSIGLLTRVVPDMPSAFALPPAAIVEMGEPGNLYDGSARQADVHQLFQPIPQPQPVKAPSPPPKPRPAYSNEVSKTSRLFMSDHISGTTWCVVDLGMEKRWETEYINYVHKALKLEFHFSSCTALLSEG